MEKEGIAPISSHRSGRKRSPSPGRSPRGERSPQRNSKRNPYAEMDSYKKDRFSSVNNSRESIPNSQKPVNINLRSSPVMEKPMTGTNFVSQNGLMFAYDPNGVYANAMKNERSKSNIAPTRAQRENIR